MTVREAESIIRKIECPQTEEETEIFRQATYVLYKAIQAGYGVVPIHHWRYDLKKEIEKMEDEGMDKEAIAAFASNALLLECIALEAKMTKEEELEVKEDDV